VGGFDGTDHEAAVARAIGFDAMAAAYEEQAAALIEGGWMLLLIENLPGSLAG